MAGISAGIIAAIAGVVGAGVGGYSAYQSKKQADAQYDQSQAAFANEVDAAETNARWKLKDDASAYNSEVEAEQHHFMTYIDTAWDTYLSQSDMTKESALLESLVTRELSDTDLQALKDNTASELKLLAEMAQLDAEYLVASAEAANNTTLTKAAMTAVEYADAANTAVQFIDGDINTMKDTINLLKEDMDIQTKEAISQDILRTANTVGTGGSYSRKLANTMIKADIMANTKIAEQENAIDKAYNSITKTGKEAGIRTDSLIQQANLQVTKNNIDTYDQLNTMIGQTKVNMEDKIASMITTSEKLRANTNTQMKQIAGSTDIKLDNLVTRTNIDINNAMQKYEADSDLRLDTFLRQQYQTTRGLEQTLITKYGHQYTTGMWTPESLAWTQFYEDNQGYKLQKQLDEEGKITMIDPEFQSGAYYYGEIPLVDDPNYTTDITQQLTQKQQEYKQGVPTYTGFDISMVDWTKT